MIVNITLGVMLLLASIKKIILILLPGLFNGGNKGESLYSNTALFPRITIS